MTDKVALVTGAALGIGKASAKRLARDGIAVGVLDLSEDGAAAVADEIAADGGRAIALSADVTDRASVAAALTRLRSAFGPVTVLVNKAAITESVPFLELTDQDWDRMMTVNLKSVFIVTQLVIPDMIAALSGRVINISSSTAQSGEAGAAHYSSSKGGIIALTRTLAHEFGEYGITANTIPPRFVFNSATSADSFDDEEAKLRFEATRDAGPIRRHGEPEDVAGAVAWLASDEAGYVTGQVIGVNGGRYI